MAGGQLESENLAIFCDFENLALGVEDARFTKFDIKLVIEKLLLKGSIVVKKAYCDWDRYKAFKAPMHEAAFEMIEIPHIRMSGKNSADIRLVVDALDLCYTKPHVDTFVILSGDSDFSPLVSKLRENNKIVIGCGVKNATSDLLVSNCDEFIFYDDLARKEPSARKTKRKAKKKAAAASSSSKKETPAEDKRHEAFDMVLETVEALQAERGTGDRVWGSMVKQTLKRRKPGFNESYYGFKTFSEMLEEAGKAGLLKLTPDEKSGGYIVEPTDDA